MLISYWSSDVCSSDRFDISSVQVLKGPQGTLFGRNTNGGAVLAYTVAPTYDFEGYVEASYGNYDARELEGAINLHIVEFGRGSCRERVCQYGWLSVVAV